MLNARRVGAHAFCAAAAVALLAGGCGGGCGKTGQRSGEAEPPRSANAEGKRPEAPLTFADGPLPPSREPGRSARVTVRVESPILAVNQEHTFDVSGGRVRVSLPADKPQGLPTVGIYDAATQRLFKRRDDERTFSVTEFKAPLPDLPGDAGGWQVTATGKKDNVAGVECELYEFELKPRKLTGCFAHQVAFFDFAALTLKLARSRWFDEATRRGLFPLRYEEHDETGELAVKALVLHFDAKEFDEGHFSVPKEYRQVKAVLLPRPLE